MMAILLDDHHLVSDTSVEELHIFAARIGMKRAWFQDHRFPHYDVLSKWRRLKAMSLGAEIVTSREIVRRAIRKEAEIDGQR